MRLSINIHFQINGQGGQALHYGDRFIPRRSSIIRNEKNLNDIRCDVKKIVVKHGFSDYLAHALGLKDARQMSLNDPVVPRLFFPLHTVAESEANFYFYPERHGIPTSRRYKDLDWLSKPRRKQLIVPHSSHEFDGFSGTLVGNLIDWAWTGQLVAYYDHSLLFWNPNEGMITKYDFMDVITLTYHPFNYSLATSNRHKGKHTVNVWIFDLDNMRNSFSYRPKNGGPITSLCWHRHGMHILW